MCSCMCAFRNIIVTGKYWTLCAMYFLVSLLMNEWIDYWLDKRMIQSDTGEYEATIFAVTMTFIFSIRTK